MYVFYLFIYFAHDNFQIKSVQCCRPERSDWDRIQWDRFIAGSISLDYCLWKQLPHESSNNIFRNNANICNGNN